MKIKDIAVFLLFFSVKYLFLSILWSPTQLHCQDIIALKVDFEKERSWEEIRQIADDQGRLIFIDLYTDWCGPCKMMDRDVFTNDKLSVYFNSNLVNYKVNAEKKGITLAKKYGVDSYPTMLFVDKNGNLIYRQVGAISHHELLTKAQEVQRFYDNRSDFAQLNTDVSQYSLTQIEQLLSNSQGFDYQGKVGLAKRLVMESRPISDRTLELTLDQMNSFDQQTLRKIAPMIGSFLPSQVIHDRIGRKKIKWRNQLMTLMDKRIQESIRYGDLRAFEDAIEIDLLLGHLKEKDVDRFYYEYYRVNDINQFAVQAEYMITKHVLSAPVIKIHDEDRRRYLELEEMRKEQYAAMDVVENTPLSSPTPTLDSVARIYNISENIANQLFEVSSDFYAFFDDPIMIKKAERWAEAAYAYFPYDLKLYDNHIVILEAMGDYKKIKEVNDLYKSLPYYHEMVIINNKRQSDMMWPD